MSKCPINRITGSNSELHQKLVAYLSGNEEEANRIFNLVNSDYFIEQFGNWPNDTESVQDRVSVTGEPELYFNRNNKGYFKLKDGSKFFIDKIFTNFNYKEKNALITSSIEYLLEDSVKSKQVIESIDFKPLYENNKANPAYSILEGNLEELQELQKNIERFLGIYQTASDNNETDLETVIDDGLGIKSSYEKNSKDNASANIKILLSFIPKFKKVGDSIEAETIEFPNGQSLMTYNSFNEIWNYFEETLANIYPRLNGLSINDTFDTMITTMRQKYGEDSVFFNPTIHYAIEALLANDNLEEWKRNHFVHAFTKAKINFYTTTINDSQTNVKLSFFNSGDVTSRSKEIAKEYTTLFEKSDLFSDNKFNKELAVDLNRKYTKLLTSLISLKPDKFTDNKYNEYIDQMDKALRLVNINFNTPSIENYIEVTEGKNLYEKTVKVANKIGYIFKTLSGSKTEDFYKNDKFINNIISEGAIKELTEIEAEFRKDISENTVLGVDNKRYWNYSLPSYLNIKLDKIKRDLEQNIATSEFYKGSIWIKRFKENPEQYLDSAELLTFLNLKLDNSKDEGVDNKSISENDQIIDRLNKINLIKHPKYNYSIFDTAQAADKARSMSLAMRIHIDTNLELDENSNYKFSNEIKEVYKNYFADEYMRMGEVYDEVINTHLNPTKDNLDKMYQYYHYNKNQELVQLVDGKPVPVGNGFKFTLFNNNKLDNIEYLKELSLYDSKRGNTPLFNISDEGDYLKPLLSRDDVLKSETLDKIVDKLLEQEFKKFITYLKSRDLINENNQNRKLIDEDILKSYLSDSNGDKSFATLKFLSDVLFNGHIANIEYNKIFSGDYSFYKNLDDYSKRVPGTYTDGIIPNYKKQDRKTFNVIVVPDELVDSELYNKKVDNTADAQGWITLQRWKFLYSRLNKWTPKHDEAYERLLNGNENIDDYKLLAQPLKGVYFDNKNGKPTYIKYSQGVLIPSIIKGTSIENLYNHMLENGIDEVIPLSGVKVGGITLSKVFDESGVNFTDSKKMESYILQLDNFSWKLQQDLSPKGIKPTLLGSQMQKNIIRDLQLDKSYKGKKGLTRYRNISRIISTLSNMGLEQLSQEIGLNINTGEISDKERFYELLEQELGRDGTTNTLEGLSKEFDLDVLISNRSKIESLIPSIINNAAVKLKTNGGSFIQMSSVGWTINDAKRAGVKMLTNDKSLKPPRKVGKKVLPGQVFISHYQIAKYIPNYRELSRDQLNEMIDDKLRYILGYRIPNQDLASNDALEIVGILPPGMGDTVIPYLDITTKTGSDYDIDKMYLMFPNIKPVYINYNEIYNKLNNKNIPDLIKILIEDGWQVNKIQELVKYQPTDASRKNNIIKLIIESVEDYKPKITKLEYYQDDNEETKEGLENQLLEEYISILTSPINFDNLVKSIDSPILENDINSIHGEKSNITDFEFFTPTYQIRKKFDNFAGKTGVGITANHSSDHAFAQLADLKLNLDLGVGNVKDGVTSLSEIYDSENEFKISEILSLFLTAYVDIAKNPYITKGNHNSVTSNAVKLLIRSGANIKWVNRFIGQSIIKRYADIELNKNSKFLPDKSNTFKKLKKNIIIELKKLVPKQDIDDLIKELKQMETNYKSLGESIRKDKDFSNKNLEKDININYNELSDFEKIEFLTRQIKYLAAFQTYNKLGRDLNSTTMYSKADVNGSPSNLTDLFRYKKGYDEMFNLTNDNDELLFVNLENKFNNFLGVKHQNSIELVEKIFEKEFINYSPFGKSLLNSYYNSYSNSTNFKINFNKYSNSILGYVASKSEFFQYDSILVKDLMLYKSEFNLSDRVKKALIKYPDNLLLQNLQHKLIDNKLFISMNNFKNKPLSYKDDIIQSWKDLHKENEQLSEDLMLYSFITSNFQFNSTSFFEYIPIDLLRDKIQDSIKKFKDSDLNNDYKEEFNEFVFRHNPELVKGVKSLTDLNYIYIKDTGPNLLLSSHNTGMIVHEHETGKRMYKPIGNYNGSVLYKRVQKLGFNKQGYYIYEHNLPNDSIIKENSIKINENFQANINKILENTELFSEENLPFIETKIIGLENFKTSLNPDLLIDAENDGIIENNCKE